MCVCACKPLWPFTILTHFLLLDAKVVVSRTADVRADSGVNEPTKASGTTELSQGSGGGEKIQRWRSLEDVDMGPARSRQSIHAIEIFEKRKVLFLVRMIRVHVYVYLLV